MPQVKSYQYSVVNTGTNVVAYINRMYQHYLEGSSSLWQLDERVINHSQNSFVICPRYGSKDLQIKIAKDFSSLTEGQPNRANVYLDPAIEFEDASNPLQQGSSQKAFSADGIRIEEETLSESFFIIETEDTVTFCTKILGRDRSFSHFGYIIKPAFSNDSEYGLNGLGFLNYVSPDCFNVYILDRKKSSAKLAPNIQVEIGGMSTSISESMIEIGGRVQPAPIFVRAFIGVGIKTRYRTIGVLKYCYKWVLGVTMHQIISDEDAEQAFMVIGQETQIPGSNANLLVAWEYGKAVIN
jgi:hypothetical protein